MFSWAKELLSPSVQTGKPVSTTDSRRKSKPEDGEMTEEGFVCVGKSSFYTSPEMPAPMYSQQHQSPQPVLPMPNYGPSTLYPTLSQPQVYNGTFDTQGASSVPDHNEFVRRIPFTVRSGVSGVSGGGYRQQRPHETYLAQFRSHFKEKYDYDFNLERGVIRELSQQASGCY